MVMVIGVYSPTEGAGTGQQQRPEVVDLYAQITEWVLRASGQRDLVVVSGDFNAAVGKGSHTTYPCCGGDLPFGEPLAPSPNGRILLETATACDLRLANTCFKHPVRHQYTYTSPHGRVAARRHKSAVGRQRSVKDYMLINNRFWRSVRDCRVYRGIAWRSDHELVAMTVRLRLANTRKRADVARPWDSAKLLDETSKVAFVEAVQQDHVARASTPSMNRDAQAEYTAMVQSVTAAAAAHLPREKQRRRLKDHFNVSPATARLMEARRVAHKTWLCSRSAAAKKARNRASHKADAAVQLDRQRWLDAQIEEGQARLRAGNMRAWARTAKMVAGRNTKDAIPRAMRGPQGVLMTGDSGVREAFTDHFETLLGGESDICETAMQWLRQAAAGRQIDTEVAEAYGRPPDLEEVQACIKALRSHAAPGGDQMEATFLKAGVPIAQWLLKVICYAWESGIAPAEWKSAVIAPLYKGKGPRDTAGSYRGISLLSIAGKVYAALLLHRTVEQIEPKLHEAQNGFRKGRGTTDAMFTLRSLVNTVARHQLPTAPDEVTPTLAIAFVDFTKAYDSISREALWQVLKLYGVHPHVIKLLEDLHTGTEAVIRVDGKVGRSFTVKAGVRQGCVIAPTLFNVFVDHILQEALSRLPPDKQFGVQIITKSGGALPTDLISRIVALMYADDLALLTDSPDDLVVLLDMVDAVASKYGLFINAAKTEIMVVGRPMTLPTFKLSGKELLVTDSFRYLGSFFADDGSMSREMDVRNVRALAAFRQFQDIWASPKLCTKRKMDVYRTFILPIFLYGCETWTWTEVQMGRLEVTHSNCLRRIIGVKLTDRHRLETIHDQCGTSSLELMVRRRTLQWMGHVLRMDEDRLPRQVFDCSLTTSVAEDGRVEQLKFRRGHRNIKDFSGMYSSAIRGCHEEGPGGGTTFRDFLKLSGRTKLIPWPEIRAAAAERALDRQAWRGAVKNLAPLEFKKPQQVGRMTRSSARHGGSG